jgi:hypothetical protein
MSKRQKTPSERPEPRPPMTPGQIASGAFGLALLQCRDDQADPYEMIALLSLEALAMLAGKDPDRFGELVNGLGVFAAMRSTELRHAALAGQPPTPLSWPFETTNVH